jgi:hypothetical protein
LKAFQTPSVTNYQTILKNLKVIYGQCAVRYAKVLDDDIKDKIPTEEHRAEVNIQIDLAQYPTNMAFLIGCRKAVITLLIAHISLL